MRLLKRHAHGQEIHRRLAAVYAMRLREEEAVECSLERMLADLDGAQGAGEIGAGLA